MVAHFSAQAQHRPGDLISQSDVAEILKKLADAGWQPVDQKKILADTLPDDELPGQPDAYQPGTEVHGQGERL